jgi:hypothetical protein
MSLKILFSVVKSAYCALNFKIICLACIKFLFLSLLTCYISDAGDEILGHWMKFTFDIGIFTFAFVFLNNIRTCY